MQKWMRWTVLEAGTKTITRLLQKVLGDATTTLGGVMGVIALTGFVQLLMGVAGLRLLRKEKTSDTKGKFGAMAFGMGALLCNIFGLLALQHGGSVIVVTFITTLSMIPGALVDRFWFGHLMSAIQKFGIAIGVFAGYAILGFPSLSETFQLPLWVWLSFGNAAGLVVNQWIVQSIKEIHPYAKNAWGGGSTLLFACVVLVFAGGVGEIRSSFVLYAGASIMIGFVSFFMWAFSLFAYKEGAYIALKKLVMNGSYLTMTVAGGVLFFGESLSVHHFIGFALYLAALLCIDNAAWRLVSETVLRKLARA